MNNRFNRRTANRRTAGRLVATCGAAIAVASLAAGCGGGGFSESESSGATAGALTSSTDPLTVLIGSSGDAETAAVEKAVAAWSADSGVKATVKVASDLPQELSQGFAAGTPADIFYLAPESLAGYANNGSILAYGDKLANKDDFYPALVDNFTYNGDFYCAPKDFSTLALVVNDDLWAAAGLTKDDYPTTWEELTAVATKLTKDGVTGLAFGAEYQRIGAFMAQAGGGLVKDGVPVASSEENVTALQFVKDQLAAGDFAYAADLGAGWGGEAFGKGLAAMVIEGNWITGALSSDFPDVNYSVVELPAGPGGKGTMQFTTCWGMATDSPNQQAGLDLIEYLTAADQQLDFSQAFGAMPSIKSVTDQWKTDNPKQAAFLVEADHADFMPTFAGTADVITDFNASLEGLKSGDPQTIVDSVQKNLEAIVK